MGYYVNTEDINIIVPKDLLEPAYKAVLAMNEDDQLKRGGSYGPGDSREFWFSWMPKDLSTLGNLKEVMINLGFEDTDYNEAGDLVLSYYNSKTGQEDLFLDRIAPFVQEGSYAIWKGEDDTYYKWEFTDGKMLVIPGEVEITWFPDNAYSAVDAWNDSQEMMAAFRSTLDAKKALDAEKVEDANA
jgi:hypothetical protein